MALVKWQTPVLRHASADPHRVAWVELFFDLIYVAALIQLGDALSSDVTVDGVWRFLAIFTMLWWTWIGTTVLVNRFAVDDVPHRLLVFLQMFAVGNLAVVAVAPLANRATWLAVVYVLARLPLLAMYVRVRARVPEARALTTVYLAAFGAGAGLFALSLLVPTPARYVVWALALGLELVAPIVAVRREQLPPLHEEHLHERFAVFTIIVLGESFVKVLTELSSTGVTLTTQVLSGLCFLVLAGLWWTYFDDVADSEVTPMQDEDAGNLRRVAWVYAHLPLAAALTAFGVAFKKVVTGDGLEVPVTTKYLVLFVGATIIALLATAALDAVTVSPHFGVGNLTRVGPRIGGAAVLVVVLLTMTDVAAVVVIAAVAVVVVGQIGVEIAVAAKAEVRVARNVAAVREGAGDACAHLDTATVPDMTPAAVCPPCAAKGVPWVELRQCLSCGHVGCCDDSPGRHGTAHFEQTGHPVIRTIEDGDTWAWCFVHEVTVDDLPASSTT